MAKKTWKKPVSIVMDIGPCRYCKKDMVNTESFVAFMDNKIEQQIDSLL